jgi:DNA repair protein RAD5
MDPWWNESVENQAIDRLHRIGQTREVHVKRFIIKDSVEEKMLDIQRRKSKLVSALTSDNGGVTLEELMTFF